MVEGQCELAPLEALVGFLAVLVNLGLWVIGLPRTVLKGLELKGFGLSALGLKGLERTGLVLVKYIAC